MKYVYALILTLALAGCNRSPYSSVEVHILANNNSQDELIVQIDDEGKFKLAEKPVYPGITADFTLKVLIANQQIGLNSPTSPTRNPTGYVSAKFLIVRTGQTTSLMTCKVGAGLTTRMFFRYEGKTIVTSCDAI